MSLRKPEWFKVDPAKFLTDSQVDAMTTEELGACFRLLCRQWIDGDIPGDLPTLGRLCRLDATRMGEAWVTLCHFFPALENGKRANKFMFLERIKVLSELQHKSDEGTRAANKRWDEVRKNKDGSPMPNPLGDPMLDQSRPEQNQTREEKQKSPSQKKALLSGMDFEWFQKAWEKWPSTNGKDGSAVPHSGKVETQKRFAKILKDEKLEAEVLAYACGIYCLDREKDGIYLKSMETFLGPKKAWADFIDRAKVAIEKQHQRVSA